MQYLYFKAVHLIFIVTWFAGLFYIVRLFVYYAEASLKEEPEKSILQNQFLLMQRRLWFGITWPSAVITAIMGTSLALQYEEIPAWLWVKIGFVTVLYLYHFLCHHIFRKQQRGINPYSSNQLRIWNEVATILLVSIIFLVVLKNFVSMLWGLAGLVVLTVLLLTAIMWYKKIRGQGK